MQERASDGQLSPEQLQQHPEIAVLMALFGGLILAIFVGSAVMWILTIGRVQRGEPVLRVEPWTPRVWGLLDLILVVGLVMVGQSLSIKLWAVASGIELNELRKEADFPLSAMAAGSFSYLIVMLLTVAWLMLRYGASLTHIGIASRKFIGNLAVGFGAALLSLPIVYAIMAVISASFSEQYDHPLLDRMSEEGSAFAFVLALFCTVVAAPIAEEFFFRVLLQGWLQSIPWRLNHMQWFTGARERGRPLELFTADLDAIPLAHIVGEDSAATAVAAVGVDAAATGETSDAAAMMAGSISPAPPLWPVFVSGSLFGLAHWGYGLSFVPLIILGIILGLLYRAKHSIWPSFVVHFILNLISMLGFGLSLLVKAIAQ